MPSAGSFRTIAGAILSGFGVTCGLALDSILGPTAWGLAVALVVAGIAVAAVPAPRRSK